jgi:hypothetical protein
MVRAWVQLAPCSALGKRRMGRRGRIRGQHGIHLYGRQTDTLEGSTNSLHPVSAAPQNGSGIPLAGWKERNGRVVYCEPRTPGEA